MVIVTERIGTALVRSENALQSQRDILLQLLTGDFPDLHILQQRAIHQQLDFSRPCGWWHCVLRGYKTCFASFHPGRPRPGYSRRDVPSVSDCSSSSISRRTLSAGRAQQYVYLPAAG
jgi:hypothetical protein